MEVQAQIGDKIDMVIDGGKCSGGIEVHGHRPFRRKTCRQRQGAISIEELRKILPDI